MRMLLIARGGWTRHRTISDERPPPYYMVPAPFERTPTLTLTLPPTPDTGLRKVMFMHVGNIHGLELYRQE